MVKMNEGRRNVDERSRQAAVAKKLHGRFAVRCAARHVENEPIVVKAASKRKAPPA